MQSVGILVIVRLQAFCLAAIIKTGQINIWLEWLGDLTTHIGGVQRQVVTEQVHQSVFE